MKTRIRKQALMQWLDGIGNGAMAVTQSPEEAAAAAAAAVSPEHWMARPWCCASAFAYDIAADAGRLIMLAPLLWDLRWPGPYLVHPSSSASASCFNLLDCYYSTRYGSINLGHRLEPQQRLVVQGPDCTEQDQVCGS